MATAACVATVESETADGETAGSDTTSTSGPEPVSTVSGDEADEANPGDGFDWQGHRGARGLRPENTLPGFEVALDLGVNTLELDLHLSADDQVVIWHDPAIEADKCGDEAASARLRELTADRLRQLDCSGNPDPDRFPDQQPAAGALAGDDYGILALGELFEFVDLYTRSEEKTDVQRANAAKVRFNVETKRRPDDPSAIGDGFDGTRAGLFEQALVEAVLAAGMIDRVTVQSFDHRSLWAVKLDHPEITLAALTRRSDNIDDDVLKNLAEQGADVWSPDYRSLTADTVEAAHQAGLSVIPWTVNERSEMYDLIEKGVDGLITDRPDLRPESP